jgi:sugar transferase (PEP-CTERM/EpsH1 system associated)
VKILFVCHRFPFPPRRGGKIRPFNTIRHLSARHDVTVASLVRSEAEAEEGKGLRDFCSRYEMVRVHDGLQALRMVARLPTGVPSSFGFFHAPELARRIRGVAVRKRFDLVFVHCSSMAPYVQDLRDTPKILDFGDMDSRKWHEYARFRPFPLSLGYALEAWKLRREEERLARRFDVCTTTTRAEWETLEGYGTGVSTDWFPNGVDADYFRPADAAYDREKLAFVGRMDYYPNQECMLDFCEHTLPLLKARCAGIELAIIGANPSAAIRRLAAIPGVTVTGSVPDVRPYLHRAALMVAPLNIARGTQNKILEAMALGVPVVASRVAAGGVDASAPEHLLVASSPQEYVEAIVRVLEDSGERARLSAAGRARVLASHAWDASMRRLDGIIERCMHEATRRSHSSMELQGITE